MNTPDATAGRAALSIVYDEVVDNGEGASGEVEATAAVVVDGVASDDSVAFGSIDALLVVAISQR